MSRQWARTVWSGRKHETTCDPRGHASPGFRRDMPGFRCQVTPGFEGPCAKHSAVMPLTVNNASTRIESCGTGVADSQSIFNKRLSEATGGSRRDLRISNH